MTRKIKLMMPVMLAAVVLYGFGNGSEHFRADKMNQLGRTVVEKAFEDRGFTTRTGTLEATGWY